MRYLQKSRPSFSLTHPLYALLLAGLLQATTTYAEDTKKPVKKSLEQRIEELEARDSKRENKIKELKNRDVEREQEVKELEIRDTAREQNVKTLKSELEEVRDDLEFGGLEEDVESDFERIISLYGFFDMTFVKYFYPEDSPYHTLLPAKSSFIMSNINLYIQSHMTQTLSALLEMRFSFLPHGSADTYETEVNGAAIPGYEYARVDTLVYDQFTTESFNTGGVTLERVHLTYEPLEWLNFIAGRFLTPYGIWNIDHGSPVILATKPPYLQIREMVPHAQTGLQVYGRFFSADRLYFDYALTVSNGRGPIEELIDLDENKGLGVKLKLIYEGTDANIAIGTYGYYGTYTDSGKTVIVNTDDNSLKIRVNDIEVYTELVGSSDLLLEFYGVRLQVEYVRRFVEYENPAQVVDDSLFFSADDITGTYYTPSYIGQGVYGLLGYTLPLEKWFKSVLITPYFLYEYNSPNDVINMFTIHAIQGGLNIAPSQWVVIKLEGGIGIPKNEKFGSNISAIALQLAVAY